MIAKQLAPLDSDVAEMERRWRESGIPGLYVGRDGPVSRERARNVRAMLYPKPKLPTGKLERFSIPGPNGPITVEAVQPVEGPPIGTLVYYHGGGYVVADIDSHQRTPYASPIARASSSSTSIIGWRPSTHSRKA
jgi:acetyl esterase